MRYNPDNAPVIVFDCDGVILNSNHVKSEAFYAAARPYGDKPAKQLVQYNKDNGGISRFAKFEWFLDNVVAKGVTDREGELERLLSSFGEQCELALLQCDLVPGVQSFLEQLHAKEKCFVVTGGAEQEVQKVFQKRGLDQHFSGILGSPTSKRQNMAKLASRGLFKNGGIYFGDARLDYELAGEFGLDYVQVTGCSEWSQGKELAANCIQDFRELIRE